MVKNYGGKYGLGTTADHIKIDSNGIAHVSDPQWKQTILNMRKDPVIAAEMAGELDKQNQNALQDNVGGKVGGTELYLAHFLGAGGATDFLNQMHKNPQQSAANVLPAAADANQSVFYSKDGTPKSLQQIYQHFAQKFDDVSSTMKVASTTSHAPARTYATNTYSPPMLTAATAGSVYPYSSGNFSLNTAVANQVSSATDSMKNNSSSLFATMMLAQMHDHSSNSGNKDNDKKDNNASSDILNLASAV